VFGTNRGSGCRILGRRGGVIEGRRDLPPLYRVEGNIRRGNGRSGRKGNVHGGAGTEDRRRIAPTFS